MLALLACLFAFGLFDHSLWGSTDAREGSMIADMFRSGSWVTPLMNGKPFLEKPPLLHWTGLALCHVFGGLSEGLLRLPAALYGFGAVLLAYLFGRQMGRERAGLAAAFMCGTSLLYAEYSKIVLTDAAAAFAVMLSLFLFWRAWASGRVSAYGLFIVVSALGFYAKGLIGPGLVWVSVTAFLFVRGKWKRAVVLGLIFVPVFALVVAPWAAALFREGGRDFLRVAFWDNQFGRFLSFGGEDLPADPYRVHKEPVTFYLRELPLRLLPWFLLIPSALVHWYRRGTAFRAELHVFLRVSLVAMAAVLHVSTAKVACYALPLFPIVFLMTAVWMEDASRAWSMARTPRYVWIGLAVCVLGLGWTVKGEWPAAGHVQAVLLGGVCVLITRMAAGRLLAATGVLLVAVLAAAGLAVPIALAVPAASACVLAPGRLAAGVSVVLALLLLAATGWLARQVWLTCRGGARAEAFLWLPPGVAALFMLAGAMLMPAYDHQRTFKPLAELAACEKAGGRRIALASTKNEYIGALTFYLGARIETFESQDARSIRSYLFEGGEPSGVIVLTKHLGAITNTFGARPFRVLKADHDGYKCDYFRLLAAEPPRGAEEPRMNANERE